MVTKAEKAAELLMQSVVHSKLPILKKSLYYICFPSNRIRTFLNVNFSSLSNGCYHYAHTSLPLPQCILYQGIRVMSHSNPQPINGSFSCFKVAPLMGENILILNELLEWQKSFSSDYIVVVPFKH